MHHYTAVNNEALFGGDCVSCYKYSISDGIDELSGSICSFRKLFLDRRYAETEGFC